MTTDISSIPAATAPGAPENAAINVETPAPETKTALPPIDAAKPTEQTPITAAPPTYVPNFKYKAALQEKELDEFWRPLVKDADSEKKVKEIFSKVDAFDFVKQKREHAEQQFDSLLVDYDRQAQVVTKFNESVANGDLSSAFRLANINKEQVFKWAQKQLQIMDLPADQRAEYERFEQVNAQKSELHDKVQVLEQKYQTQAVQARTMALDMTLSRPETSKFAEAWDKQGEPGSFRQFVIDEAKRVYYEQQIDLSPEQAVAQVMKRFGKFLNVGDSTQPAPQAPVQANGQREVPVIPNVSGKAASPVKKVPQNLDDLKKLAREASR